MSNPRRTLVSAIPFLAALLLLVSPGRAHAQWYLDPVDVQSHTDWSQTLDDPPGNNWYGGSNVCYTYNKALQPLFGTTASLGVDVEVATGNFVGVFAMPASTGVGTIATNNAAGAWWAVYGGPFQKVISGVTDSGVAYRELQVITGFGKYQVQGNGPFFAGPALLQRYWIKQNVRILSSGAGQASCIGFSKSAPPGCEQCN